MFEIIDDNNDFYSKLLNPKVIIIDETIKIKNISELQLLDLINYSKTEIKNELRNTNNWKFY